MKKLLLLTLAILCCSVPNTIEAQSKRKKKKNEKTEVSKPQPKKPKGKIKPYSQVITNDAITDEGLFNVHKVGEKYYFEIPMDHLGKDMLLVSRIAKLPSDLGGGF